MTPHAQRVQRELAGAWRASRRDPEALARATDRLADDARLPCKNSDPELFFPEHGRPDQTATAIKRCDECYVSARHACLIVALSLGRSSQFGVWGGTSAKTRTQFMNRQIGRERRSAAG